jgi:lysophospholipase L1-like esterase
VRLRRLRKRLGLSLLSLATLLAIGEIALRLSGDPESTSTTSREPSLTCERDARLGWVFPADTTGLFHAPGCVTPVTTNAWGLRNREVATEPSVLRVLVLGDSYAFGWGVPEEDGLARRLEDLLADALPALRIEVVNAALPGYSVYQQVRMLDFIRARVPVHAVVATISLANDPMDELRIRRFAPDRLLEYRAEPYAPGSLLARLFAASRVLSLLDHRTRLLQMNLANLRGRATDLTVDSLRELAGSCHRDGLPLIWLVVPRAQEVRGERGIESWLGRATERQRRRFLDLAAELEVPILDLQPLLADPALEGRVFLKDGVHWTALGHAVVAGALAPRVADDLEMRR